MEKNYFNEMVEKNYEMFLVVQIGLSCSEKISHDGLVLNAYLTFILRDIYLHSDEKSKINGMITYSLFLKNVIIHIK